ncbi:MAG: hypothetical protein ABSB39_05045 [Candidatus Sulfotelmatobacter sp.]|jgi:hypothetical protein
MPLTPELRAAFEAVLRQYESEYGGVQNQVSAGQARLKELHNSISTLQKSLNPEASSPTPPIPATPSRQSSRKYAFTSVRWAILDLLAESEPKTTAEIAEDLIAAGVQTKAANFANNVSAVLSTTLKEQHGEVEQLPDGKWRLTDNGKSAIEHIRTTPKFREAMRGRRSFARY